MTAPRDECFFVEDGFLIRRVTPRRGRAYEHTCSEQVFKDVALAIEQIGAGAFNGEDLVESLGAPNTQVFTALAFLKDRGCIVPARERKHRAAADCVYEDALIEWHALREGAPGSR